MADAGVRKPMHRPSVLVLVAVAALAVSMTACARRVTAPFVSDPLPVPSIAASPLEEHGAIVGFRVRWSVDDPRGRVDHFLVAFDPPRGFAAARWVSHPDPAEIVRLDTRPAGDRPLTPRSIAVRAVDAAGRSSAIAWRVLSTTTVPPTVVITRPCANPGIEPYLPPDPRFEWAGNDPDGVFTTHPVKYRFRLFREGDPGFSFSVILSDPDSLRRAFAPGFAGWDSLPGDTTTVAYVNLSPSARYAFVVVAVDEAGDINSPFSRMTNVAVFRVESPRTMGPLLTLDGPGLTYFYSSGGYSDDPSRHARMSAPADQPLFVRWSASDQPCATVTRSRWAVDITDLADPTPRSDEATDLRHWSAWTTATTAGFGPFHPPGLKKELHRFYVEVEDSFGWVSLGAVDAIVSRGGFDGELLVVDDTRGMPDYFQPGTTTLKPPSGRWPTAAELDTFLFARGGMPWQGYPPGTLSPVGILAGYAFDTLGTRTLPGGLVPLELLNAYRHVVWMTDPNGATSTQPPGSAFFPMSALKAMTTPGQVDVVSAYVRQGGRLWLLGGTAAYTSLLAFDRRSNNGTGWTTFASSLGELRPGQLMFDLAHAQSSLSVGSFTSPIILRSPRAVGGWPGAPDYTLLPSGMQTISSATGDPIPPLRTGTDYYNPHPWLEWISDSNPILEDLNTDPGVLNRGSSLDTLYAIRGSGSGLLAAPAVNACMLYYHGSENPPLVYSGFDIWSFSRSQCIQLTDFVLQRIWGLSRQPVNRGLPADSPRPAPLARR